MRLRVVPVNSATFLRVWIYRSPLWISEKNVPVEISRQMVPARRAGNLPGKPPGKML